MEFHVTNLYVTRLDSHGALLPRTHVHRRDQIDLKLPFCLALHKLLQSHLQQFKQDSSVQFVEAFLNNHRSTDIGDT